MLSVALDTGLEVWGCLHNKAWITLPQFTPWGAFRQFWNLFCLLLKWLKYWSTLYSLSKRVYLVYTHDLYKISKYMGFFFIWSKIPAVAWEYWTVCYFCLPLVIGNTVSCKITQQLQPRLNICFLLSWKWTSSFVPCHLFKSSTIWNKMKTFL